MLPGVVSKSADGIARTMAVIVEVFGELGLAVSEKNTGTLLMRVKGKQPAPTRPPLIEEAARQRYTQTTEFRYLGGLANEGGELTRQINSTSREAWACITR